MTNNLTDFSGKRIGPFQLFSALGTGRTGVSYRAYHMGLFLNVSLKILYPHVANNATYMAHLQETARQVGPLRHHNLLPLIGVDAVTTTLAPAPLYYVATGYVEGRTLEAALRSETSMRLLDALRVIEAVGAALDYLHSQGVIHYDVKPANIFLGNDGRVYLIDVGLAPIVDGLEGATRGTPAYMAPEQAASLERTTQKSDLYGLATVLYEILAGSVPWPGATTSEVSNARATTPLRSIHQQRPELPAMVDEVFQRALAAEPSLRPRNAKSLALALRRTETLLNQSTNTPPRAALAPPKPRLFQRFRLTRWIIGLVVLIVLAVICVCQIV